MNYHDIRTDDMLNGSGLRVVIFVSGCTHNCPGCHNPQTHDFNSGVEFDNDAMEQIMEYVSKDHISGITLSGGDPLHPRNIDDICNICSVVKSEYPNKNIWCYTGYTLEELKKRSCEEVVLLEALSYIDVLVEGRFKIDLLDRNYPWAGSTNQRVIDLKESTKQKQIILYVDK